MKAPRTSSRTYVDGSEKRNGVGGTASPLQQAEKWLRERWSQPNTPTYTAVAVGLTLLVPVMRGLERVGRGGMAVSRSVKPVQAKLNKDRGLTSQDLMKVLGHGMGGRSVKDVQEVVIRTDRSAQGRCPVVTAKAKGLHPNTRLPVVVCLHATHKDWQQMWPRMQALALRGYLAVAIDARYHGARALEGKESYSQAHLRAYRGETKERPFLLDTVWDVVKLVDYLRTRRDVDRQRIGMTGVSLGGMHTWLAAAADERIAVVTPMIGVQNFRWGLQHDQWQARVASVPWAFDAAAAEAGKPLDAAMAEAVWERLAPGLLKVFDVAASLPLIAPRPLLILNGGRDERNPVAGLQSVVSYCEAAYAEAGETSRFRMRVKANVGHWVTEPMEASSDAFLDEHLRPNPAK